MDYLSLLVSVNKISILFFIVVVLFLAYEFYLFKRGKKVEEIPKDIPDLNETIKYQASNKVNTPLVTKTVGLLFLYIILFVFGYFLASPLKKLIELFY